MIRRPELSRDYWREVRQVVENLPATRTTRGLCFATKEVARKWFTDPRTAAYSLEALKLMDAAEKALARFDPHRSWDSPYWWPTNSIGDVQRLAVLDRLIEEGE